MTASKRRLPVLLLLALFTAALSAQRTELTVIGGVFQTPYRFADRTQYPHTSFSFPWSGDYRKDNVLLGADLSRALHTHWQVATGLRLFLSGYAQVKDFHWPSEVTPDGTYSADLPIDRLAINHLFLEVPLLARYLFSAGKCTPYIETGISTNYYLTTGVKERLEGGTKKFRERNDAVRPVHFTGHLDAGLQYRYSDRQALFVQAALRYQLNTIEEGSENPGIGYGLNFGWRLRLKA